MAECQVTRPKVCEEDCVNGGGDATLATIVVEENRAYSHPVYKKLATINGHVNKMTKDEIKAELAELKLDTRGVKEVLKKRLKNYYKRIRLSKVNINGMPHKGPHYDYYLVIDFEATCDEFNMNYKHEIIEFPIVMVDPKQMKVVDEFHSYVRPLINRQLTPFCSSLTGITQRQVDSSPSFMTVLDHVHQWMEGHKLGQGKSFAVVTDGPWDMGRFMYQQCQHSATKIPNWARKWLNIRKAYRTFYRPKGNMLVRLKDMLESLGMTFQGNEHSGIDDSRNIARVLLHMLTDGASMRINEELYSYKIRNNPDAGTAEMKVGEVNAESSSDSDCENCEDLKTSSPSSTLNICQKHCVKIASRGIASATSCQQELQQKILVSKMKNIGVRNNNTNRAVTSSPDGENIEDLLEYYALQKS